MSQCCRCPAAPPGSHSQHPPRWPLIDRHPRPRPRILSLASDAWRSRAILVCPALHFRVLQGSELHPSRPATCPTVQPCSLPPRPFLTPPACPNSTSFPSFSWNPLSGHAFSLGMTLPPSRQNRFGGVGWEGRAEENLALSIYRAQIYRWYIKRDTRYR